MPLQQVKIKGVADVVFVLDTSGSMADVIEAVKQHIGDFVSGVQSGQFKLDLRLGLVLHPEKGGQRERIKFFPFTSDVDAFLRNLGTASSSGNEFQLPAIDAGLDFEWREKSRRMLIFFSDEPVAGGYGAKLQRSKIEELKAKFVKLHVSGYIVGPPCPQYDVLDTIAGFTRVKLTGKELAGYPFGDLLADMGKTVSTMSQADAPTSYNPNLFGV